MQQTGLVGVQTTQLALLVMKEARTITKALLASLSTSHASSSSAGWVASQGSSTDPAASCRTDSATGKASGRCDTKTLQAHRQQGVQKQQQGAFIKQQRLCCQWRSRQLVAVKCHEQLLIEGAHGRTKGCGLEQGPASLCSGESHRKC